METTENGMRVVSENLIKDSIFLKVLSNPVDEAIAKKFHLEYLQYGPPVLHEGNIVHSLSIDRDDLKLLYDNGLGGVKLYFGSEKDSTGRYCLTIIAVPYDSYGENVFKDNNDNSTLVNNLDPCPTICPHNNIYSERELNFKKVTLSTGEVIKGWYQPNQGRGANGWRKENGDLVVFP